MTTALYPGSFDPVTNGHLDIIQRASAVFGRLIVAVYERPEKTLLFPAEKRVKMLRQAISELELTNVEVQSYDCLTVDYARRVGARVVVRGLRMSADFEREFEMAMMNKRLAPDIELVCLMTSLQYQFLSSSLLKEIAELDGSLDDMVPQHVAWALKDRFSAKLTEK